MKITCTATTYHAGERVYTRGQELVLSRDEAQPLLDSACFGILEHDPEPQKEESDLAGTGEGEQLGGFLPPQGDETPLEPTEGGGESGDSDEDEKADETSEASEDERQPATEAQQQSQKPRRTRRTRR